MRVCEGGRPCAGRALSLMGENRRCHTHEAACSLRGKPEQERIRKLPCGVVTF